LIIMDSLVVAVAQYLIYLIMAAAGVIWVLLARHEKAGLAVQAVASARVLDPHLPTRLATQDTHARP
jgi:hypothetical protein